MSRPTIQKLKMQPHGTEDKLRNGPRVKSRRLLFFVAVVSAAYAGIVWAHEGHKALPTKGARVDGDTVYLSVEAQKALGLTTAELDIKDLEQAVTATASVVAPWKQHAFVTTKVGGRLERILCRPGDLVEAGQVLAEIESLELENEQLELIQFKLELQLARQTLERAESLGGKGIVPERDVRAAQTIKVEKSTALEVTKRKLAGLGLREETLKEVLRTEKPVRILPIHSPVTGIVIHCDETPGRIVEPTEHLFEILDLSTVWVKGMVVEAETYRLKQGQPVRVSLAGVPGKLLEGKIDYIALQAEAASRAVPVWVVLTNPDPRNPTLRPGMFGSVEIVTERVRDVVACPTAAPVTAGAETYVFVEQKAPAKNKPGEYVKRNVVLGLRTPNWVEVKEGLFPGDKVVLKGGHELSSFFVQGVLTLTLEAQRNIKLQLQPVEDRPLEDVVTVNGTVEVPPDRKAVASSRIPGKIARILVDLAEPVRAGQPVAEVESLEFQSIQLDLIQTHARLKLVKDLLAKAQELKTVLAEQEVLQRKTEVGKTENQLNGLKRKLRTIGLEAADVEAITDEGKVFDALPVRSPIDGYMVRFDVIPGQVVKAETPLFEIHDMSKVWVRGYVFEKDLPKVRLEQPVRIRLASDPAFLTTAKLVRTNYVLSSTERVLSVWAELDNPERKLKDNMLARMTISAGVNSPVTAVPIAAVLTEGSEAYVFVKKPDKGDYFDRRPVEVGHSDDRFVEIKSGLKPGELVAIGGVHELRTAYASVR
ncbi:MAG: efflux RND transporter periplasmic adaptor subunit [Planctomycetes bacterium]|nr:efflux RND transporter periplasmic adaptor subunit [Planctomycetota bacterium]